MQKFSKRKLVRPSHSWSRQYRPTVGTILGTASLPLTIPIVLAYRGIKKLVRR